MTVFISYSRRDKRHMATVRSLIRGIVDRSVVFVDTESLRAGQKWADQLAVAILQCDVFVVIWSWRARDSIWVKRELSLALATAENRQGPKILPVVVDKTPLSQTLSSYEAINAIDETESENSRLQTILATLAVVSLAAITIATHVADRNALLGLVGLLSMWIAIACFWAIRATRAPWSESKAIGILFGVLPACIQSLKVLLIGSTLTALLAAGLTLIQ